MKEMRYTWEGGEGIFLKDITFKLPDRWKEYQPPVDMYELKSGTTNVWVKRADAAEIERKREEERKQEEREVEPYYYYYEKNGWYWLGKSPMSVDKKTGFPEVRFGDLFRGKRPGDTFYFTIEMVYSFDNEPEITQNIIYEVKAFEGSYVSPFGF
jgi:hypothetical protein